MNPVKLLANNWQPLAVAALIGAGLAAAHHQGYKAAFAKQQAVIEQMKLEKAQALLMSSENYARELEKAREEAKQSEAKTHAAGVALAQKQAAVRRRETEHKKEIENVLAQDQNGGCIDGFGANSLRLYTRALGYGN